MTFQQPPYPPPGQPPYNAPGYPGGYYAQPPGQYGQAYPPPPPRGTNGFAIASLIFGILGGVLLSVIFGIVALSQTKKRGQGGRGMAIAGLVLSGLWTLFIVVAIVMAVATDHDSVRANDLSVGDCIETIPADNARVSSLPKVSCATPHSGEVYAVIRVTENSFPGQSALQRDYRPRCALALASYTPKAAYNSDFDSYILYPTQATWDHGDRTVVCIVTTSGKRTGSVKD